MTIRTRLLTLGSRGLVALLLLLAPALAIAADQQNIPTQLTLSDALSLALTNSSVLRTAQSRLAQASGRYLQSRSFLLPQVEIGARQAYQTIDLRGIGILIPNLPQGKSPPFASLDARIAISQELLNIANIQAWKSSRSRKESYRLQVDDAREVVVLNVLGAYLGALRAKASRDALTEQTQLASDLYSLTQSRVKQGVSAPLDANRAMQQVNSLEQQRQEAEQSYIAAKLTLADVLQARITSDFEVSDTQAYGSETAMDMESALKKALASRPDYRSAEANLKAAELQVSSAKALRLPTFSVGFSDGQSGSTPAQNTNTYRVQGTLYLPVFTGGRTRGQIEEAEGALREARSTLDQLRSEIETDVQAAFSGVQWAVKEVATSAANVTLSRQEVDLARDRFTHGVTDNTEIVNAQDRVSKADDARVRALYTLGLARANLARAMAVAEATYKK